ncbi:MAG TPA: ABC transporter ATP-binding protein [Firmicutes bacterium]|nr:ABC transporter ATP-binding protein [Bacillota bacterium]
MQEEMLSVENLTMKFGSLVANDQVSFSIRRGEIVALIGPNGAGKTTLFNCITGFYRPTSGRVIFDGKDITGLRPYKVCRLGLTRTFQIVKPLKEMTVEENIMTGAFLRTGSRSKAREIALKVMDFTHLADKGQMKAGSLTIADKKRLEIARVLATGPKLLMLDEAMAGLNQTEIREAMDLCLRLRESGITLLVVEHIMEAIMPISDRVIVLDAGKKIADDVPAKVVCDERVITAYLGEKYHAKSKKP